MLFRATIHSPLGPMLAVANEDKLFLLEFTSRLHLARNLSRLQQRQHCQIESGHCKPIEIIQAELKAYFAGHLQRFNTPIQWQGTPFQCQVWQALQQIPFGETYSYAKLAQMIQHPKAVRAVALANAANQFAIIVPCHRVIQSNGQLGGYAAGKAHKAWLIGHESRQIEMTSPD